MPENQFQSGLRRTGRGHQGSSRRYLAGQFYGVGSGLLRSGDASARTAGKSILPESVTHVLGTLCHLRLRAGPPNYWSGQWIRTTDLLVPKRQYRRHFNNERKIARNMMSKCKRSRIEYRSLSISIHPCPIQFTTCFGDFTRQRSFQHINSVRISLSDTILTITRTEAPPADLLSPLCGLERNMPPPQRAAEGLSRRPK